MDIPWMRSKLLSAEPYAGSERWVNKVNNMYDNQVIAVYKKFEQEGRFAHPARFKQTYNPNPKTKAAELEHQITFDELYSQEQPRL